MGGRVRAQPAILVKVIFATFTAGYSKEVVCRGEDGGWRSSIVGVESAA